MVVAKFLEVGDSELLKIYCISCLNSELTPNRKLGRCCFEFTVGFQSGHGTTSICLIHASINAFFINPREEGRRVWI